VNTSPGWQDLDANITGWRGLVAAARASGLRGIPDPTASIGPALVRPASGQLDDTTPNRSEGARLIVETSARLGLPGDGQRRDVYNRRQLFMASIPQAPARVIVGEGDLKPPLWVEDLLSGAPPEPLPLSIESGQAWTRNADGFSLTSVRFTGAEDIKTAQEAAAYGGTAGVALSIWFTFSSNVKRLTTSFTLVSIGNKGSHIGNDL
jgi:hypothetical protein